MEKQAITLSKEDLNGNPIKIQPIEGCTNLYTYGYEDKYGRIAKYGICTKSLIQIQPQIYYSIYISKDNTFLIAKQETLHHQTILDLKGEIILKDVKYVDIVATFYIIKDDKQYIVYDKKWNRISFPYSHSAPCFYKYEDTPYSQALEQPIGEEDTNLCDIRIYHGWSAGYTYYFLFDVNNPINIYIEISDTEVVIQNMAGEKIAYTQYMSKKLSFSYLKFYFGGNVYGVIIRKKLYLMPDFDDIEDFMLENKKMTFFIIYKNSCCGIYDPISNKEVFTPIYDEISPLIDDYFIVYCKSGYGLFKGKEKICDPIYDNICYEDKSIKINKNDLWGIVTSQGIISPIYEIITDISSDQYYYAICQQGKWGIIDINNVILITPQYQKIESFSTNKWHPLFKVMHENFWGVIGIDGRFVIPAIYDEIRRRYARKENVLYCYNIYEKFTVYVGRKITYEVGRIEEHIIVPQYYDAYASSSCEIFKYDSSNIDLLE